jgi:hypothetical protein
MPHILAFEKKCTLWRNTFVGVQWGWRRWRLWPLMCLSYRVWHIGNRGSRHQPHLPLVLRGTSHAAWTWCGPPTSSPRVSWPCSAPFTYGDALDAKRREWGDCALRWWWTGAPPCSSKKREGLTMTPTLFSLLLVALLTTLLFKWSRWPLIHIKGL